MSNAKQETIADIVREMRTLGRLDGESTDKIPRTLQALGLRTYADRIEAAHRLEVAELKHWIKSSARWIKCHDIYHTSGGYLIKQAKEILNDNGEFLFKKEEQ